MVSANELQAEHMQTVFEGLARHGIRFTLSRRSDATDARIWIPAVHFPPEIKCPPQPHGRPGKPAPEVGRFETNPSKLFVRLVSSSSRLLLVWPREFVK